MTPKTNATTTPKPQTPAISAIARHATDEEREQIREKLNRRYRMGLQPPVKKQMRPSGEYRVIHGVVWLPNPARWKADGSEDLYVPRQLAAKLGDVVQLTSEDATRMCEESSVEPVDVARSRVAEVWQPPKPVRGIPSPWIGDPR